MDTNTDMETDTETDMAGANVWCPSGQGKSKIMTHPSQNIMVSIPVCSGTQCHVFMILNEIIFFPCYSSCVYEKWWAPFMINFNPSMDK